MMIMQDQPQTWADAATWIRARHRLPIALLGNALMRVAGGASAVLVGLYLADLANRGASVNAAVVGALGAVPFGAELLFAVPTGMLSDAIAPRALMTGGALLGAAATQMFGMTGLASIFFLSRAIEGIGAAAGSPPLLAFNGELRDGCPYDCGLCPDHQQHTCLGIIEVNSACNMNCPLCFSEASPGFSLTLEEVEQMLDDYVRTEGNPEVVQFSGGDGSATAKGMDRGWNGAIESSNDG